PHRHGRPPVHHLRDEQDGGGDAGRLPRRVDRGGRVRSAAGQLMRRAGLLVAGLLTTVVVLTPIRGGAVAAATACSHARMPFAGLAGAQLSPTDHVSKDTPSISYTLWRGTAPGFDG